MVGWHYRINGYEFEPTPEVVQSLGWEDPLEEGMATHPSILAWRIPLMEETGGLQSMGSQRVGHDLVTQQQQQAYR